ncbi:hypothetical protein EMPG_10597 [Blastomyces silverae]|uniref:Receptor L-domain domain-containing protein n=1 Tax=Blastomyces silverae TaxID=2060906 RepID=A0A0H1B3H0_9EURO|nr:hypothetical protein EMPG_10597 [Blastomyces silverae]
MRNGKAFLLAGILTAAVSVSPTLAQLGEDPPACNDSLITIATKEQVDFYSTCPRIDGAVSFSICNNFTGPFEVPNITYISGKFNAGYFGPKYSFSNRIDDGVTSISMPDLEELGGWLLLGYLKELTSVSFPKLHTIGVDMAIIGNSDLEKLEFPSLENITAGALIDGHFDEIHFPKLKHVRYLKIKSTGDLDCRALGRNLSSLVFHPESDTDVGKGFTCWTSDENNRFNSSEDNPPSGTNPNPDPHSSKQSGRSLSPRKNVCASPAVFQPPPTSKRADLRQLGPLVPGTRVSPTLPSSRRVRNDWPCFSSIWHGGPPMS